MFSYCLAVLIFTNSHLVYQNVLAGTLFGTIRGFPLVCLLTAIGSSICYTLSDRFGRKLIEIYFPSQTLYLRNKIEENSHQLIYYLLFLRLFPVTPNWLINLLSPIVGVPIHLFFITIFIGLMPYNFLCVQAGGMLASLTQIEDVLSSKTLFQLALMAAVVLGPSFFLKRPLSSNKEELNGGENSVSSKEKSS
uniref:VTT domain-containing protein n=1 Tax=Clastoptera arizonana TaxID=38151 RepID=A0A1B6DC45_9HEMI